ncbi:MAG: FG-GAP-like repeat-containing protein [Microcoleaceae cyanobacterium]
MTQFIDEPVTVSITRMKTVDNLDGSFTGEADFRSTVTIDGKVFPGKKFEGDDDLNPGTAWTFTNTSSQLGGIVPLKIEIIEEDTGPDTRVDINPLSGKKDLNFFLNVQTGEVISTESGSSQRLGFVNQPITLRGAGDNDKGEITVVVSGVAGPEAANSVFIQSAFVQDAPESNDLLGGGFFSARRLVTGDFNDDGRDDLVVGSPNEGLTHVSFGSSSGLSQSGIQTFNSSNLVNNGQTFAVGDINGDGVEDLVLGTSGAGATVKLGVKNSGLTGAQQPIVKSSSFPGSVIFGASLTTGDFNGDGKDDVATGDPLALNNDGAVQINYGSSSGITTRGLQVFHRDTPGVLGSNEAPATQFAQALAAGDINRDGFDDLVIGAPGAPDTNASFSGAFHVLYGSTTGLTTTNNTLIGQSFAGVSDKTGDRFGESLDVADVNGDLVDDVIIGAPGSNSSTGQGYVYFGRQGQNFPSNNPQILTKSNLLGGLSQAGDQFGASIDAQQINTDNFADIIIGAPGSNNGATNDVGTVHLTFGSASGASSSNVRLFQQGFSGVAGIAEAGDRFGTAVAIGNFNGSGSSEIVASAPFEDFGNVFDAGLVNIFS